MLPSPLCPVTGTRASAQASREPALGSVSPGAGAVALATALLSWLHVPPALGHRPLGPLPPGVLTRAGAQVATAQAARASGWSSARHCPGRRVGPHPAAGATGAAAVTGGAPLTGPGARSPHGSRVAGLRVTLRENPRHPGEARPEESPQVGRSDRVPLPPGGGPCAAACHGAALLDQDWGHGPCARGCCLAARVRVQPEAAMGSSCCLWLDTGSLGSWVEEACVHLPLRSHPAGALACVRTAVTVTVGKQGVTRWHSGCSANCLGRVPLAEKVANSPDKVAKA